ncbi:MAG: CYTH domain-containing protein [Planctomycetota bacterium]|nr:CYTH domain-containing protein [Planctomycetota bacterium]
MGVEIERKFLVQDDGWGPAGDGRLQHQGYLAITDRGTMRVRIEAGKAILNLKSAQQGLTRAEFEYEIPLADGERILERLCGLVVEKTRYKREHAGHVWDVDVFHGANEGLVVAEVELADENEAVELPAWVGQEVSHDVRYRVAHLSQHPFSEWEDGSAASK